MPGNYPEESTQHSEQGKSLKSRINSDARELPGRKHTTFRTRRKFEIRNKFRRRGITQKKAHNIQNTAKV
jgi:hypothetical protein